MPAAFRLLTLAVSRLTHGAAGPFSIDLPFAMSRIECRSTSIYTVVFTFANTLTSVASVNATATGPIQPGPSSGSIDSMDAHNYIANLTMLPNAQKITVTLSNVNDSDGNVTGSVPTVMGLLIGDANANGAVNSADVAQTKSRIGQPIDGANFRSDVNANGVINSADIANVKIEHRDRLAAVVCRRYHDESRVADILGHGGDASSLRPSRVHNSSVKLLIYVRLMIFRF